MTTTTGYLAAAAGLGLAVSAAIADTGVFHPIDPTTTFQLTCEDPADLPLVIDLDAEGYAPGDTIRVQAVGDFAFVPGGPEDGTAALGVFSSDGVVLADRSLVHRVPGAIQSDAPDFETGAPNRCPDETTDIPEDFLCDGTEVIVPDRGDGRAAFLVVSAYDEYYSDNIDADNDFGVMMSSTTLVSTFDASRLGWTLSGDASSVWRSNGGNPGGFMRINDAATGDAFRAVAPNRLLGDLSEFDKGRFSFDALLIFANGPTLAQFGRVEIAGPSSVVTRDFGSISPAGTWGRFDAPLTAGAWGVPQSEWEDLLACVTSIRILMEAVSGDEAVGLDNVVVSLPTSCNPADVAEPLGCLDLADVTSFAAGFFTQDPIADLNPDGLFDLGDVNLFVTSFLAGCP